MAPLRSAAHPKRLQPPCALGQEGVGVGNVLCSYKAALAVGVQDPRRGDLDPQVAGMSGIVQRMQRLAGAMRPDANGSLAASCSGHAGAHEVGSASLADAEGRNFKQATPKSASCFASST
jgi:hypothetical protein